MRKFILFAALMAATAPALAQTSPPVPNQDTVVMMSIEQARRLMALPPGSMPVMTRAMDELNVVRMSVEEVRRLMLAPNTAPNTMIVMTPDVLMRLWSQRGN